jgi:hypothetical protein
MDRESESGRKEGIKAGKTARRIVTMEIKTQRTDNADFRSQRKKEIRPPLPTIIKNKRNKCEKIKRVPIQTEKGRHERTLKTV